MSDSLRPHGLQHARILCPLPARGACSNSLSLDIVNIQFTELWLESVEYSMSRFWNLLRLIFG